jgi:hypothetical protein
MHVCAINSRSGADRKSNDGLAVTKSRRMVREERQVLKDVEIVFHQVRLLGKIQIAAIT